MARTYTLLLYHIVFSTKHRAPLLSPEARALLFPYISGIISNLDGTLYIVNGVADHIHILCRLQSKPDVAEAVQAIKGSSSAWFNKESGMARLRWQEGYGAFSVSFSQKDRVYRYIQNQEKHHAKTTFADEYESLLVKHETEYDKRFFLD